MGDKLSTEDLTGRRTVGSDEKTDGGPVRSPLSDSNRAGETPRAAKETGAADDATREDISEPLLGGEDATRFERRWHQVQVAFVDEPRSAVEQADNLVAELMRQLAETFADERGRLEEAWSAGEDVDTEQLRVALTRYRSFFHRLLAT
jgi:hypothetical protein